MKNVPNRMFMECFMVLTKVAKKGCCHGYQVTKENKIANEYLGNSIYFVLVKTEL